MKNVLLLLLISFGMTAVAQRTGELAFFSNTGEKFYVVLNGVRQNQSPETNVKVTGLTNEYYACKVISSTNSFELDKNVMVSFDTLTTYQISGKKGKYKLRGYSQTALNSTPVTTGQTVIAYNPSGNTGTTGTTGTTTTVGTTGTTGTTTTVGTTGTTGTTTTVGTTGTTGTVGTTTTTTTTGTTTGTGNSENVNISINVNENGLGINMTGTGLDGETTGGTTTTHTTTSTTTGGNGTTTTYYEETTTTTTTTGNNTMYADPDMTVTMTTTGTGTGTTGTATTTTTGTTGTTNYNTTGTTGGNTTYYNNGNCYMSDSDFAALKKSIEAESFSEDQLRVANMAAKNKCMNVAQIKEVMTLFSFSSEQLAFAKTAYDNCTNKNDYYQVMEVFTFSGDKEELEKYINSK